MGSLIALLIIVVVSLIMVRFGSNALMLTGLSWDTASFQAYSAFFGVGFTTSEAEMVVNHPIRRRIIRDLILAGNVGLTSAVATLIVTFVETKGTEPTLIKIGIILGGVVALLLILRLRLLKRVMDWLIHATLKQVGMVRALDYELLLQVEAGYCISEVDILQGSALEGRSLRESRPADHGVIVLGVTDTKGKFRGTPNADQVLNSGDVAIIYGKEADIRKVSKERKE
tara:strand:+ start:12853 stop:13536 length:684 start_codon:yes stop_codon:yes gene_type:complete